MAHPPRGLDRRQAGETQEPREGGPMSGSSPESQTPGHQIMQLLSQLQRAVRGGGCGPGDSERRPRRH
jgi:hypothetical protein